MPSTKPLCNTSYAKPQGFWQTVFEHPLSPKSHGHSAIRELFFSKCKCSKTIQIYSSMAGKYLHKSEHEVALLHVISWSGRSVLWLTEHKLLPRKQVVAFWSLLGLPRAFSSTVCSYSALTDVFDILKKLGKKNRTWDNRSTSSSNCPQMKIFWSWLLTEGSWEISKTFLGKHRVSSKQGLSEPRNLSNRARLVVTNDPWESGKNSESVMAPIKERDNTSQLCFFCQWGAKFACAMIRSFKNQRKRHS